MREADLWRESDSSLGKQKIPTGQAAMLQAFPTYKHHKLPTWLKKAIRSVAVKKGTWSAGACPVNHMTTDREFPGLWDHWGSLEIDGKTAIITQPYRGGLWVSHEALIRFANKFAEQHSCSVQILEHGIWHPGTCAFIFSQL